MCAEEGVVGSLRTLVITSNLLAECLNNVSAYVVHRYVFQAVVAACYRNSLQRAPKVSAMYF